MPRYDFLCESCGIKDERVLPLARYDAVQSCVACGGDMTRLISAPCINPDWQPYIEENMGQKPVHVQSRAHYKQELARRNLTNLYGEGRNTRWV